MEWTEFQRHLDMFPPETVARIRKGYMMGSQAHGTQKRKSGEPYFYHPVEVAAMLAHIGADPDTVIAALLHDTLEDTDLQEEEIEEAFGKNVLSLVQGVTKLSQEDFRGKTSTNEQVETLRKMFGVMQNDVRIMVIKLVDRLHNMKTVDALSPERQKALAQETQDVYVKIADRLCMQGIRDQLAGLCLAVLQPEQYQMLSALRRESELLSISTLELVKGNLHEHPAMHAVRIEPEAKSWQSLLKQSNIQAAAPGISDATLVFVCADEDTCYRVLGALHGHWKREMLSFQDFISSPQVNGYKGLHTTILLENGTRIRCKIRTEEMNAYDRKGIVTMCFDNESRGLMDYFGWAKDISQLSEDTRGRSGEFWESLQHDILGEAIVVHGPADELMYLPQESTALDGAFYLFREQALRMKSLHVNGREVPPGLKLRNGDVLTIIFDKEPMVRREWIRWAKTGLATAIIRSALASTMSDEEKLIMGRMLLQQAMDRHSSGFVEEIDGKALITRLERLGYEELDALYTAIANGHIDAEHAFQELLAKPMDIEKAHAYVINYEFEKADPAKISRLNDLLQRNESGFDEIHYSAKKGRLRVKAHMTDNELQRLQSEMQSLGARELLVSEQSLPQILLLATVIVMWALNPVIAKYLLLEGISTWTLLTVRMLTFGALSGMFYMAWKLTRTTPLTGIRNVSTLAILPTFTTFCLAFFTYKALETMPPSGHLTFLRFNVLLAPLAMTLWKKNRIGLLIMGSILFLSIALLLHTHIENDIVGPLFSLLALCLYVTYSMVLESTLQGFKIGSRYPQLLFATGVYLGIIGLALIPTQSWAGISLADIAVMVVYTALCVFIPHACFYAILKKHHFKHVSDPFLLEVPVAIAAEILLLQIVLPPLMYGLIALAIISLLAARWHKRGPIGI